MTYRPQICDAIACCVWNCDSLSVKSMYMIKSWLKLI